MRKPIERIDYTKGEEIFSAVVHIVGAGLGIIGTAVLVVLAALKGDALAITGCSIYGFSMIVLYTMSSLYHMIRPDKAKKFFRVMDHDTIFLLIAGTYTPYLLIALRGVLGLIMMALIWGMAIVGIVFNSIDLERFKVPSVGCYVIMGWAIIFTVKPLLEAISVPTFILLLAGGLFYTGGLFFYVKKKIRYFHSIWHIFVLLGTLFQYFSVLDMVISL